MLFLCGFGTICRSSALSKTEVITERCRDSSRSRSDENVNFGLLVDEAETPSYLSQVSRLTSDITIPYTGSITLKKTSITLQLLKQSVNYNYNENSAQRDANTARWL